MLGQLPVTINGYTFKKILGKGGFSTVYLCESQDYPGQVYCGKVTQINPEDRKEGDMDSTETEIKALMSLSHQNIIKLYDHFTSGNHFILILEYCSGGSLQNDRIDKNGLPLPTFISYAKQIISALAFCHSKHIAHRDIKPGNILLDSTGHIKLSDFGISLANANVLHNTFSGSLLYEPPEIINKKAHNPMQADIWSLGVLFAYMINGITPWRCDNIGLLKQRICDAVYRLRSSTPPEVSDLIKKMIVKDPNQRMKAADLLNLPLFTSEQFDHKNTSPDSIPDVLSPRGRARSQALRFAQSRSDELTAKTIHLFKMNLLVGTSKLPKIKPRYHITNRDSFVIE